MAMDMDDLQYKGDTLQTTLDLARAVVQEEGDEESLADFGDSIEKLAEEFRQAGDEESENKVYEAFDHARHNRMVDCMVILEALQK